MGLYMVVCAASLAAIATTGTSTQAVIPTMCGGHACVAVKNDGTAVVWGSSDASHVDLTNVADAMCGGGACVARKYDGTAVAWGSDASHVDLTNVADVMCGERACVARKYDGTAVAWGSFVYGGDASRADLRNVADAMCGGRACVARKNDGTAVVWGDGLGGGDASSVELTNVADAMCGGGACVARKYDGTAVAWGDELFGGDASGVDLTNVADVMCGGQQCVARKNDGTAVSWGLYISVIMVPVPTDLRNVADAMCGWGACVARKNDSTVVAWGDELFGGDASGVDLTNVADVMCGRWACVARKCDGTAVVWGSSDASHVDLTNVADAMCGLACVARKNDGTAVAWGSSTYGGDPSSVDLTNILDVETTTPAATFERGQRGRSLLTCTSGPSSSRGMSTLHIALIVIGGTVIVIAVSVWQAGRCRARVHNLKISPEDTTDLDFEFVDADKIKDSQGALPMHQQMLKSGWLRPVRLSARSCLDFTLTYCVALSYVWMTRAHPDPEGEQADALRSWLRKNPHITHVWIDWCSLPQGERTPAEKQKFKLGLANVNIVYLSCYVLKVLNSQYSARFWPQYEAWLSYHRFSLDASDFASDTVSRSFSVFTGLASSDQTEQGNLEDTIKKRWSDASVEKVVKGLGHSDVSVTNCGDKPRQFDKIRELRTRFQSMNHQQHQVYTPVEMAALEAGDATVSPSAS